MKVSVKAGERKAAAVPNSGAGLGFVEILLAYPFFARGPYSFCRRPKDEGALGGRQALPLKPCIEIILLQTWQFQSRCLELLDWINDYSL